MENGNKQFTKRINLLGRWTSIIALFFMLLVPFAIAYYYQVEFQFSNILAASLGLIATFLPTAIAENISYYSVLDRKSTRLNSSHVAISYAVFCFFPPFDLSSFPTRRSSDLGLIYLGVGQASLHFSSCCSSLLL